MTEIVKLPTYEEIVAGDIELKGRQNDLNRLLNYPPPAAWLKTHPSSKNVKYIPIERIEYLLTKLFIRWNVEIKQVMTIANSVVVTIRLYYQDVTSDEMLWQDGIGASPIQTEKGAGAMDWQKVKHDAVMKAAPAAESYAIKDAAEKIGKIFGKDMNRADKIAYEELARLPKHEELFTDLNNDSNENEHQDQPE